MMAVIAPTPVPTASRVEFPEKTLLAALALTSFSALLLELALTRLFSVVLFYHFAFLSISIALLGLGAGGVFAYLLKSRLASLSTRSVASRICLANSVIVLARTRNRAARSCRPESHGQELSAAFVALLIGCRPFLSHWTALFDRLRT